MMTTKPISSPKMFIRLIAAALICLAPLTVSADPNPADLARKASSLARLAVAEEDPKAAVVGAFEAHNLWNRAFQADGNELHLCNARSLLAKICARSDLETEHRVALEASRKALPKCPKSAAHSEKRSEKRSKKRSEKRSEKRLKSVAPPLGRTARSEGGPARRGVQHPPQGRDEFRTHLEKREAEGIQPTVALLDPFGDSPARSDTPAACDDAPAYGAAPACDNAPTACDAPSCDAAPAAGSSGTPAADAPQRSPLSIAGISMLSLAAPALGGTVYALIADRAIIREVDELTTYEPDQADRLEDQARSVQALAIGLGVTTAVLTGTGISLIIAGRRRSKKSRELSLVPQAGRDLRGLALIGRF